MQSRQFLIISLESVVIFAISALGASKKRCKELIYALEYSLENVEPRRLLVHLPRQLESLGERTMRVGYYRCAIYPHGVLKMVNETAVIEVYRAYNGVFTVGDERFLVDKAGSILVYPHTRTHKPGIGALGHHLYYPFIRDGGGDYSDVDPSQGGVAQSDGEIVIDNEIRSRDINVALRLVYHVQKHVLTYR